MDVTRRCRRCSGHRCSEIPTLVTKRFFRSRLQSYACSSGRVGLVIRFLSIGPRLCSMLLSGPTSRWAPLARSAPLRIAQPSAKRSPISSLVRSVARKRTFAPLQRPYQQDRSFYGFARIFFCMTRRRFVSLSHEAPKYTPRESPQVVHDDE